MFVQVLNCTTGRMEWQEQPEPSTKASDYDDDEEVDDEGQYSEDIVRSHYGDMLHDQQRVRRCQCSSNVDRIQA